MLGSLVLGSLGPLNFKPNQPQAVAQYALTAIKSVAGILRTNKKDTHFNCLNKQHSLNSCPWPAPVAPPSRWPTHLSETYADNFESGWISVLFL
jgi:hypothetical protein